MVQQHFNMDQFVLFGDSITQHSFSQERGFAFGAELCNSYVRRLDVVNRGFSGYNTRQALQVLPHALPDPKCARMRFLTFFFGANDARLPETPGGPQQHIPLGVYKENTIAMITHRNVSAHEDVRLILITPPAVDERKCLENDQRNNPDFPDVIRRKASVTATYAEAIRDIGSQYDVQVLDLWTAMIIRAGGNPADTEPVGSIDVPCNEILQSFVHDGLHLSPTGYEILYDEMMALISERWPDQMPDKLSFVLPAWDNPEAWHAHGSL
ncbi:Isoamyl acetate-hydrolyzing esterase 1 [Fulvia fulva]|nr:Isoamyl acetate-hydrolyzing esterase 1 [Fulvia fulva]KAK4625779.1 Isoamyl acetate-hydrolyzing esterase 1 [Fulvia fulva]WPV15005.1 Isoamyl acetate-hydrolyzing esterase 1 [Fulvia fulva]